MFSKATGTYNRLARWQDKDKQFLNEDVTQLDVLQFWVTKDGFKVTGAAKRQVLFNDWTNKGMGGKATGDISNITITEY